MLTRVLGLLSRTCLGILLILNGPANALAIGLVSVRAICSCARETPNEQKQGSKKCCGRCSQGDKAKARTKATTPQNDSDNIRPTCPACPSCPNFPSGCCVGCPCKAPLAPPVVFVMPESPELVWRLADADISLTVSHTDLPIVPPRLAQFVTITI
ncbi:MAG: hypothetical protein EXR98_20175 [Gemmataceae bacterium]|nr:hypothetical protein [Gemmataceae bacterium]